MALTRAERRRRARRAKKRCYTLHYRYWGDPKEFAVESTGNYHWNKHLWEWSVRHERVQFHCWCDWCASFSKDLARERVYKKCESVWLAEQVMYVEECDEQYRAPDGMSEEEFEDHLLELQEMNFVESYYVGDEKRWRITLLGQIELEKQKSMRKYRS